MRSFTATSKRSQREACSGEDRIMEISPYMLSLLLLYSLIFGVSAGAVNDANRIVRIALGIRNTTGEPKTCGVRKIFSPLGVILISIQDILLFAYMGVGVVVLNFYLNRGIFRIYSVFATAVGFALYYFTLGRAVMLFSERIIRALRFVLGWVFKIITAPIRLIVRLLRGVIKKLYEKSRFAIAKRKVMRYNKIKREELREMAKRGFMADAYALGKGAK